MQVVRYGYHIFIHQYLFHSFLFLIYSPVFLFTFNFCTSAENVTIAKNTTCLKYTKYQINIGRNSSLPVVDTTLPPNNYYVTESN